MRPILFLPFVFGVAVVTASGCGAGAECESLCDRAHDCRNNNIDTSACKDRCESEADASDAFRNDVEACDDCLGDQCNTNVDACRAECANVVEVSSGVSFDETDANTNTADP